MKIHKPAMKWSPAWRWILLPPLSFALLVLFWAGALGSGIESAFFMTLEQIGHMVVHYPVWAWLLFAALLVGAVRLWGIIGALLMYFPVSAITHRLDVGIIGATGADTADLIFALGCFFRMTILIVAFFWLLVLPTILWRKRKLDLTPVQAWFLPGIKRHERLRRPFVRSAAA